MLVQEAIYIVNIGTKDEARKRELLVLADVEDPEDADSGECQHYDLELPGLDRLPLSDYPW